MWMNLGGQPDYKTTTFEQKEKIYSIRIISSTSLFMADMNSQYQRCQGTYLLNLRTLPVELQAAPAG